jgi:hypothetical protein
MLQDAARGATAAAIAATNNDTPSALPAAVNRTKSTPQTPLSINSRNSKATGATTLAGSEGKRKWWAIFTPKSRLARDSARREAKSAYLDM